MPRLLKKVLKVVAWTIASVIVLLVAVALLIQIPAVQLRLTKKAVAFLEDKIGTRVELEGIRISFPKSVVLEGLFLEDQQGDTLLYAGRFSVDTDLWGLTRSEIRLNKVALERTVAFATRAENDSAYNFTYILDAFAGDSTAVPDTLEQKGWDFSMEDLSLNDIRLLYDDRLTGTYARIALGEFDLGMEEFDLERNTFRVEDISLSDTRAVLKQTKLPPPAPAAREEQKADSASALIVSLNELSLENLDLQYEQVPLGQIARVTLGKANINADKIDLSEQDVALDKLGLHNTFISYTQNPPDTLLSAAEKTPRPDSTAGDSAPWKIAVREIDLSGNNIQYDDNTKPRLRDATDFSHLLITALEIKAANVSLRDQRIAATIDNMSFREQSGFNLKSMKGIVEVKENAATLKEFLLETGNSRLGMTATAEYNSLQDIAKARLSATIRNSSLGLRDVAYFQPSFSDSLPVNLPTNSRVGIDAALHGTINDLRIDHLIFNALSETSLQAKGRVAGLPSADNLRLDVSLDKFRTTKTDVEALLPDTLLPDSIRVPAWIELSGGMKGSLKKADFFARLASAAGDISVDGNMNTDSTSALRGFDATLKVDDFAVGRTLGQPDSVMGNLTMEAKLHTTGLTPEEMNGMFTATLRQFSYNDYHYEGLKVYGTIRDQLLSANASMQDENLDFTLDAGYAFGKDVPRYELTLDMRNADFQALNLSATPIKARGTLLVDLATSDFKQMNGNVGIRKVAVFNGDKLFAIDSLLFASIDQEGRAEINIDSDLLEADFEGSINIFGLPQVMREYFHSYYALHDSLEVKDAPPQHFSFQVRIKNTEILTGLLVPQLTTFVPGDIKGEFDSRTNKLDLQMHIRDIQYANIGVDSLVFSTNSDSNELRYALTADRILVDSMVIDGIEFRGQVANDSIRTDLVVLDSANTDKYMLEGVFHSLEKGYAFSFVPGGVMLNYQKWAVPASNYMEFGGKKFIARDVELSNRREKIIIASDPSPETPIRIGFREMNLEYLVSMIAEERLMSGLLQGDIELLPDTTGMTFTSDLTINDFRLRQAEWGDLAVKVARNTPERFDVDVTLKGADNDVGIRGFYGGGALDLTAELARFNLPSLQPLLQSQVADLTGSVEGLIRVKGSPEIPDVDGKIAIRKARFHSLFLNSTYSIDDETIAFIDEGISFDRFEVVDNGGNKARLDGNIMTRTYRDFRFALTLTTDEFRLLNTTEKDNDLFYGKVDIEAVARIGGTISNPVIDMQVGLSDGSNLTYVVPQSEASVLQTEGIVRFVDRTFEGDPFMQKIKTESADTVKSSFTGIDLTARLELTDQENFTIIIDPVTGDQLTVRGNTTLTLKIDPTGDIQLAGRYEITEGTYNLSFYKFVKREFSIEKGSTITWSGDPLNAEMDITAVYRVETAPMELFSNQLAGAETAELNQYRQRLPFLVYLNITGELLQPGIGFELEMPMNERNAFGGSVYARLQDINTRESDLNKQVFALLILKRFISDNPFENQSGGGFESTARSSVSKILSEQLNRLSENIKGVELSFDIKSYEEYSSGQAQGQTELQLGVSKSLLNDRLVVKLSGNVDVEGRNGNRQATDYIGDLALEYKLTPDGRLRITGFRNSNYDMIDGELTETGAGLIYVKDYNALRELFKANAKTRN